MKVQSSTEAYPSRRMRHKTENPFLTNLLYFILVGVWSSAIFEKDLDFFVERHGISVFVIFSSLSIICSAWLIFSRSIMLRGRIFFLHHKIIIYIYSFYWIVSFAGSIYSPNQSIGFFVSLQYLWYTAITLLTFIFLNNLPTEKKNVFCALVGSSSLFILLFFILYPLFSGHILIESAKNRLSPFRDYNVLIFSLILGVSLMFLGCGKNSSGASLLSTMLFTLSITFIMAIGLFIGSRRSIVFYGPISIINLLTLVARNSTHRIFVVFICSSIIALAGIVFYANLHISSFVFMNQEESSLIYTAKRLNRVSQFLSGDYGVTDTRTARWQKAVDIASNFSFLEMLFGRGTRSYFSEPEFIRINGDRDSPHNFLLASLLEGGILKLTIIVIFVMFFIKHIFLLCRNCSFWLKNFLISTVFLWMVSVSISGAEFFSSKQFLLIFVVYAVFWKQPLVFSSKKNKTNGSAT